MAGAPEPPERIVFPRKPVDVKLGIIAVSQSEVLIGRTGEVYPRSELVSIIATEAPSMLVAHNVNLMVAELDKQLTDCDTWQFRATPVIRESWEPNRKGLYEVMDTVIAYVGFQKSAGRPSRYHFPVDPVAFVRMTAFEIRPDERDELGALFHWGQDLLAFLQRERLRPKPTSGGIAGQLLRDPRFYPDARRKVPRATNARARDILPGNYYRLLAKPNRIYEGYYLDQRGAHHSAATDLAFPDANTLMAKGYFRDLDGSRVWAQAGSKAFKQVLQEHGLIYAAITSPGRTKNSFEFPWMERRGAYRTFIFTNELPDFYSLGGRITSIIAAWTSPDVDRGLNRYAEWSRLQALTTNPNRKRWLKPTLLAAYGILAAKPKVIEFGYRRAKGGTPKLYPVAGEMLEVITKATPTAGEMPTANVIHRGLIEAETRLRSLRMARSLQADGLKVLAVYADSVFVDAHGQLPLLPQGWEVRGHLHGLRFYNSTSFSSDELTKLPGIPREARERMTLRASFRASVRQAARMKAS